ncbi:RBBP9/YdeN family alpha/beta hydrolase [Brevibacterium yomogidense]|uniref:RBBP9/YdeN family alpha/beta hydrolase n=1 Tax=Brevibacterium yomogidense TaxID=946573 RepID=UPI0018DF3549|nr:alpha/beta hydrolase [Brevibacterium yomogidense]
MRLSPHTTPFERVVVVHGFRASPQHHWFPWIAEAVPGAEVVALPDSASPDAEAWVDSVTRAIGAPGPEVAVVAHSLGCVTAVRTVQRLAFEHTSTSGITGANDRGHRVSALGAFVAVSPFSDPLTHTGDQGLDEFASTGLAPFLDGVDLARVRPLLGEVTVIRSDDDPLVAPHLSDAFAEGLGARTRVVAGARHFLAAHGATELPEVIEALNR